MDDNQKTLSSLVANNDDLIDTKLELFVKDLQYLGLNPQQIEQISGSMTVTLSEQVMLKISALMSDEDWTKWKAFIDVVPTPNTAQQVIVMNEYLKNRINKDLEGLYNEILEELAKNTIEELKGIKDLKEKVATLSDEEVDKAQQALEEEDYDKVDKIISKTE